MYEIERKFILKKMPSNISAPIAQQRYYIVNKNGFEMRTQRVGSKYYFERKVSSNELSSAKVKFEISETEFNELKRNCREPIERDNFKVSGYLGASIKIYKGKHNGLKRAEFEFESENDATAFEKPDWVGEEITSSPIGRDGKLAKLSEIEFKKELQKYL